MKSTEMKYRKITGLIILISYLSIFTLNIFHFHNIYLSNISKFEQENSVNAKTKTLFSEYGCIVQLSFTSLHTVVIPSFYTSLSLKDDIPFSLYENLNNKICGIHLSAIKLRAPPLFS